MEMTLPASCDQVVQTRMAPCKKRLRSRPGALRTGDNGGKDGPATRLVRTRCSLASSRT